MFTRKALLKLRSAPALELVEKEVRTISCMLRNRPLGLVRGLDSGSSLGSLEVCTLKFFLANDWKKLSKTPLKLFSRFVEELKRDNRVGNHAFVLKTSKEDA